MTLLAFVALGLAVNVEVRFARRGRAALLSTAASPWVQVLRISSDNL